MLLPSCPNTLDVTVIPLVVVGFVIKLILKEVSERGITDVFSEFFEDSVTFC